MRVLGCENLFLRYEKEKRLRSVYSGGGLRVLGGAGWRRKSVSCVVISRAIHLFTQSLAVMGGAQKVDEETNQSRYHLLDGT